MHYGRQAARKPAQQAARYERRGARPVVLGIISVIASALAAIGLAALVWYSFSHLMGVVSAAIARAL